MVRVLQCWASKPEQSGPRAHAVNHPASLPSPGEGEHAESNKDTKWQTPPSACRQWVFFPRTPRTPISRGVRTWIRCGPDRKRHLVGQGAPLQALLENNTQWVQCDFQPSGWALKLVNQNTCSSPHLVHLPSFSLFILYQGKTNI